MTSIFLFLLAISSILANINVTPAELESLVESLYSTAESYSFEYKSFSKEELELTRMLQRDIIKYAILGEKKFMESSALHKYVDVKEFADEFMQVFSAKEKEFQERGYDSEKGMETILRTFLVSLEEDFLNGSEDEKKAIILNIIGDTLFNPERSANKIEL